jgi:signal transduction histidine kinase
VRTDLLHLANLRLLAMLASLVVIVAGAYLVRQRISDENIGALRLVSHTHEVRAALYELSASLGEMQAAAFAAKLEGLPGASGRYIEARSRYGLLLDHLRDLTRDDAGQQERIGMLRARIEERVALFDRAMSDGSEASADLATAVGRFPVDDIAGAIIGREEGLVRQREDVAERHLRSGRWLMIATTLAQLLLLGAVIWISERQLRRRLEADEETRRAVGRAQLIVETVREPMAVIDADLRLVQVNRAFAQFYEVPQSFPGTLADIPAWSDEALNQRLRDVSLTQRELWDYEASQQTGGDVPRQVVVNARPMALTEGDGATALLTVSDQTARRRYEQQVLELNRQLSGKVAQVTEVNRELEAFSYSVSHDLRAPLRHITGFADKLRQRLGEAADEKTLHYCETISDAARRMAVLIEDLLSYSRLGRHALRLQPVDMQSLVEEVQSTLMSGVEDRTIDWDIAPLPVVIADSSMMRLAWQNLLENAIKYSAGREEAVIGVGVEDTGQEERVFWIRDNGVGFDMRHADKLFGVFQRLHKASAFPGSGIGLASVRRIIARHGGRTWATAEPGRGATFFFSLPRHDLAGQE